MHQAKYHQYTPLLTQQQQKYVQEFSPGQKSKFTQLGNSYDQQIQALKDKRQTQGIQQRQADLLQQQQQALRKYVKQYM